MANINANITINQMHFVYTNVNQACVFIFRQLFKVCFASTVVLVCPLF